MPLRCAADIICQLRILIIFSPRSVFIQMTRFFSLLYKVMDVRSVGNSLKQHVGKGKTILIVFKHTHAQVESSAMYDHHVVHKGELEFCST